MKNREIYMLKNEAIAVYRENRGWIIMWTTFASCQQYQTGLSYDYPLCFFKQQILAKAIGMKL